MVQLLIIFFVIFPLINCEGYRLNETIIPSTYTVDLTISEGVFTGLNDTFDGQVALTFRVSETTTLIQLHHRVTEIQNIDLTDGSGSSIEIISDDNYNTTTEILTIETEELNINVDYVLTMKYYSTFETTAMRGFYKSSYLDENNNTAYLITTQFEPVSARHAFPCLDEPQYKATFIISLTYPKGLHALSNTNNITTVDTENEIYEKSTYLETNKTSTYLLAFIISEFTCTSGVDVEKTVTHRVCSRDEEKDNRKFAVEVGTPILRTLESITALNFGNYMPKMDQVAIPDFSAGAMENWGLVTYRETGLLFSEENTSNSYKKSIALVIAHEFTHMWFGNLVTCKWWDYTFLNEGFARFYQYFAAAATKEFLDWELEKHFVVEQVHTALLADSSSGAQALTSPAESPSEISAKFGTISYNKGASILRMIEQCILGPANFIYGIRDYLQNNQLTGAVPADLWTSLAQFVPSTLPESKNLSEILENWVEYSGHPVVYVTKNGNDVILSQERFLLSGSVSRSYYVPITYTVSSDPTKFSNTTVKSWLVPGENLTISNVFENNEWIILNNRQSGFYRVDYDTSLWEAIKSQLHSNHLLIDVLNRAQLISDAFNFARAGRNGGYGESTWTFKETFSLLSYLEHETDYYPWYAAIIGNNHLLLRIGYDTEEGQKFITWMLGLMQNVYNTVPFEVLDSSDQVYTMKQVLILTRICKYGEESCISKAKELFQEYRDNNEPVPKNLRTIVYCNALRHSDDIERDFNFLWQKYTETKLMSEIITIYQGLGCAQDVTLLKWYLRQTVNATAGIRVQDFTSVWSYVYSSSKIGTDTALEFIAEEYQSLTNYSVSSLISNAASYIYDLEQLEKLENLLEIDGISDSDLAAVSSAITSANSTIIWAEQLKSDVLEHLDTAGANALQSFFIVVPLTVLLQRLIL